ncbi:RICIN domain-containing protein [Sphaerimonospora thailandensis]|uniref:Ricin B lectin domain-containing protein n=1 Tax=Sphaerimonospora thailandensis TaxID=795644 RepID=A0A8J3RF33_9ACTN|nr:hypothetical protein Mth01_57980 [Sphaerimonospora thailandensis]
MVWSEKDYISVPAYADGTYKWQNEYNRHYLEVYQSSTANKGRVITWPIYNSANQLWSDFTLSDGYYRLMNNNSRKWLGFADQQYGNGYCGFPDQYDWLNASSQWWDYRKLWDQTDGRYYSAWVNKMGCQGNAYVDMLSVVDLSPVNTSLLHEATCSDQRYGSPTGCYWRRDGG